MEKLLKKTNVLYTQNIDALPIEERIFFSEGLVVNVNDFRIATKTEINEWEKYKEEMEKDMLE